MPIVLHLDQQSLAEMAVVDMMAAMVRLHTSVVDQIVDSVFDTGDIDLAVRRMAGIDAVLPVSPLLLDGSADSVGDWLPLDESQIWTNDSNGLELMVQFLLAWCAECIRMLILNQFRQLE